LKPFAGKVKKRVQFWSAPAERSGDGAFDSNYRSRDDPKRCRAALATALQNSVGRQTRHPNFAKIGKYLGNYAVYKPASGSNIGISALLQGTLGVKHRALGVKH